jgi:hypothetical protein
MTQILIELYEHKPAWLLLSMEERQAFFARIGTGMAELMPLGIEPLGPVGIHRELMTAAAR